MARIRSIKPEFWTSAQVMECSPMARLLFVGMWNFADDAGRMTYSPKTLKAQVFPSDDISAADIKGMIVELSSNGLILIYSAEDKEFIAVTGWHHQKIDKPRPSKLPGPFDDGSTTAPRKVATDLILSEGKGRDQKGSESDARAVALAEPAKRSNSTRGQRLPEDWQPTPPDLAIAETLLGEQRARGEIEKFRDYWKAQPGQRGVKLDWNATFRVWVRNAKPAPGRGPPREENAYRQSQQETKELLNELENFAAGCGNGRQADLGLLSGNPGIGQAGIHLGTDRDAAALPARGRGHGSEPGAGHTIEAEVLESR